MKIMLTLGLPGSANHRVEEAEQYLTKFLSEIPDTTIGRLEALEDQIKYLAAVQARALRYMISHDLYFTPKTLNYILAASEGDPVIGIAVAYDIDDDIPL